jgi:hypothetical protein
MFPLAVALDGRRLASVEAERRERRLASCRRFVVLAIPPVAYLALFVALGGSSYAAVAITGRDVRDGSLTGRDIRNNSLTGRDIRGISGHDVRNNSLTGADVANLRRGDFVRGQLTPVTQDVNSTATVSSSGHVIGFASCPSGQVATGGGFFGAAAGTVRSSWPADTDTWAVEVSGATPGSTFQVYAVCAQ